MISSGLLELKAWVFPLKTENWTENLSLKIEVDQQVLMQHCKPRKNLTRDGELRKKETYILILTRMHKMKKKEREKQLQTFSLI